MNQFALVSYIPGPLGNFLDQLRMNLSPCNPHAHVTVLPPRPLDADLNEIKHQIQEEARTFPPFEVELGSIEIFPISNVIYLDLIRGGRELHELYARLNHGPLAYAGPFPYHPHITIAQDFEPKAPLDLAGRARRLWAEYDGPRMFPVETLSFVQHVVPGMWIDVAQAPLAMPVPAGH